MMSKIRLSVDDGCSSDVRVAELARKYGIECVFYWPVFWHSLAIEHGYEPLSKDEAEKIAQEFEIGSHTVTHRHLTRIPKHEALTEIYWSKRLLSSMFGVNITKFAPPRGYSNEELTDYTLSIYETQRLTKQKGLVHIHPKSGANDLRAWRDCINEDTEELFCHSWELDKYNLWEELEGVLSEYSDR